MRDILAELRRDHANISRVIRVAARELDALEAGDSADYSLLEEIMRYLTGYSDAHHHPTEDVLFAELEAISAAARAEVEALTAEHETLTESGRDFLEAVEAIEEEAIVPRDALVKSGRDYFAALDRHMRVEEARLFPLAAKELSPETWHALTERIERAPDPLFGPAVDEEYRRLWQRIDAHTD